MQKRAAAAATAGTAPLPDVEDPDDDNVSFVDDDDEPCDEERDDPTAAQHPSQPSQLRGDQASAREKRRGRGTGLPRPYMPRPLPPLPGLPELVIAPVVADGAPTPVSWTSLYKYLGFMLRADLLDDHAYARVEQKTKAAAERLFPHHRLVRAWSLSPQAYQY